jgi:hypothetical protein
MCTIHVEFQMCGIYGVHTDSLAMYMAESGFCAMDTNNRLKISNYLQRCLIKMQEAKTHLQLFPLNTSFVLLNIYLTLNYIIFIFKSVLRISNLEVFLKILFANRRNHVHCFTNIAVSCKLHLLILQKALYAL